MKKINKSNTKNYEKSLKRESEKMDEDRNSNRKGEEAQMIRRGRRRGLETGENYEQ